MKFHLNYKIFKAIEACIFNVNNRFDFKWLLYICHLAVNFYN